MNIGMFRLVPIAAAVCFASSARAEDDLRPFATVMGSYVMADDSRPNGDAFGGALALGLPVTSWLELELRGSYLSYESKSVDVRTCTLLGLLCSQSTNKTEKRENYRAGVGVNIFPLSSSADRPSGVYVHADALLSDQGFYDAEYDLGVGYDLPLNLLFKGIGASSLRAEALYHDNRDFGEVRFNVGVSVPLGRRYVPTPTRERPAVVVPVIDDVVVTQQEAGTCRQPQPGEKVDLSGCSVGDVMVLRGVNFETASATLTPADADALGPVSEAMLERKDIRFEISGHTDSVGDEQYNQMLSEDRATSVRQYMIDKGVEPQRMVATGFGMTKPIADNAKEEGRTLNRRVEIKVLEAVNAEASAEAVQQPTEAPAPDGPQVNIAGFEFVPPSITAAVGSTVTWTNNDSVAHTVKFEDGQSALLAKGARYSRRFDSAGTYVYECGVYPYVTGQVVVQ